MKNDSKTLNFITNDNGEIELITTAKAVKKFRKELYWQAKNNLEIIKDSIQFILVSELEKVAGTDFGGYIKKNFTDKVHKNEINGVNNLISLVKKVASERNVTEPCIAYLAVNDRRLLVVEDLNDTLFLNATVNFSSDFDYNCDTEKGITYFGRNPLISNFCRRELKEYECDYKLVTKVLLKNHCSCTVKGLGSQFDEKECKGCNFYSWIAGHEAEGKEVLYIKAI